MSFTSFSGLVFKLVMDSRLPRLFYVMFAFMALFAEPATSLVVTKSAVWPKGSKITVGFVNEDNPEMKLAPCDPEVRSFVKETAPTWSRYANVDFEFVEDGSCAQIVINCHPALGHLSAVGQAQAEEVFPQMGYTMNLAHKAINATDLSVRHLITRTVLHEFG